MTRAPAMPKPSSSSPSPSLSKREIRWGQALLAAFVLLAALPYLWCALLTPEGMTWGGLFFSADDQNVHLMWAKQAQEGSFFIRDLFTTEGLVSGDRPLFFNLFSFGLGLFSRLPGLDLMVGYHIARVAFAGLFVHQLHRLLVAATDGAPDKENTRLGALALAVFTTGGGFMLAAFPGLLGRVMFLDHPANGTFVTVPEAFALLSALIYPLNIASFALLCFLLRCLIENKRPAMAFVAALVLSNIHTYDALPLLLACLVGLASSLVRREPVKPMLGVWSAVFIGLLLPVVYQAVVFRGSEEFRVKALTPTTPPVIWGILSTFAPLLLLCLWAWRARWTKGSRGWLLIYALSVLALVYLPKSPALLFNVLFTPHGGNADLTFFSFARKMIEGFQIPLLVFAGAGLAALPRRKFTAPLVIAICAVSPFVFYKWTLDNAAENNASRLGQWMPRYYLSNGEAGALIALQKDSDKSGKEVAVLCSPMFGSYVPRATGLFTFTGHWAETLHPRRKNGAMIRFLSGQMAPDNARSWLRANKIKYVVEGPLERFLTGPVPSASRALGLRPIYSKSTKEGEVTVYEVD